jgi:hypothetical protein
MHAVMITHSIFVVKADSRTSTYESGTLIDELMDVYDSSDDNNGVLFSSRSQHVYQKQTKLHVV